MSDECNVGFSSEDSGWILSSAIVVMSMQGGFALVEAGGVKKTNSVNIMMKNVSDLCIGAFAFWFFGWSFAYGSSSDSNSFIGSGEYAGDGLRSVGMWFFQFSFAATASTIDSGAVAERFKFLPYLCLSFFMTAWIYPVVAHWVWTPEGFLASWGFYDFAGSGVVHLVGGCSGLIAASWVGPRINRYHDPVAVAEDEDDVERIDSFQAEDPNQQLFGTLILWIGWYGFNCGSTLALSDNGHIVASHVALTTTMGGAAGGMFGMVFSHFMYDGKIRVEEVSNGILAGLVGVTASAPVLQPWQAVIIGCVGAFLCHTSINVLNKFHIDDPVSAISIHGVSGLWGIVAVGLFATEPACGSSLANGSLFMNGRSYLVGVQLLGALIILCWAMANTLLFLCFFHYVLGINLRVPAEDEIRGLDNCEHDVDIGLRTMNDMR